MSKSYNATDDSSIYLDDYHLENKFVPGSFFPVNDLPTIPVLSGDGKFYFECTVCFEEHVTDNGMIRCEDFFGKGSSVEYHMVCVGCIQRWVTAPVGKAALAPGGVGLSCVDNACQNVILMIEFEKYLPQNVLKPFAERLQNECIAAAGISNIITCTRCQVKGTCSETPEEKLMECACGFVQCLNCNLAAHDGKTCSEVLATRTKTVPRQETPRVLVVTPRQCHQEDESAESLRHRFNAERQAPRPVVPRPVTTRINRVMPHTIEGLSVIIEQQAKKIFDLEETVKSLQLDMTKKLDAIYKGNI